MKYQTVLLSGLAALLVNSCKFEISTNTQSPRVGNALQTKSIGQETYKKQVIFQEDDVMPITFLDRDLEDVKPQYQKVVLNLTRLYAKNNKSELQRGTAVLVNPSQILTAQHAANSPTLEYILRNRSEESMNIQDWIRNIDADTVADIAVINLQNPVLSYPSLQFYDRKVELGLPIALITYNDDRIIIKEGEVTRVYTENGREKFETNISSIFGNSGGVYINQQEGKIVGVTTHMIGQIGQGGAGPSIHTLDVQKRVRILSQKEREKIEIYTQFKEFEKRKATVGYNDFIRGDFYVSNDTVCVKLELYPLLHLGCEGYSQFKTIKGVRRESIVYNKKLTSTMEMKFTDGQIYRVSYVRDVPNIDNASAQSLVYGEW